MKPIVPGCLCVIIGSKSAPELNGVCVEVIRKVSSDEASRLFLSRKYEWWEVDRDIPLTAASGMVINYLPFCPTNHLLRIDGHEPETQQEKREVTA